MLSISLHHHQFLFLIFTLFLPLVQSTCYLSNGTAHDDPGTGLCSTDPSSPLRNVCSHTRWTNPSGGDVKNGPTADICLSNGLCENRGNSSILGEEQAEWTRYYKVYCANKDWEGCLNVCNGSQNGSDVAQLTPCDGTPNSAKWCCGDTMECCTPGSNVEAVVIPSNLASNASASNSSTSSVSVSTSSVTSTSGHSPLSSDKPANKHSNKRTTKVVAGSAVGGIVVLLLAGVFLLWRRRNKKITKGRVMEQIHETPNLDFKDETPKEMVAEERYELQGDKLARPELEP